MSACESAFQKAKALLVSGITDPYNAELSLPLVSDASPYRAGAVLPHIMRHKLKSAKRNKIILKEANASSLQRLTSTSISMVTSLLYSLTIVH